MPENLEAWELWKAVRTQWRSGGLGANGLDYPAVYLVAGTLEIQVSRCTLSKIQALERFELDQHKPEPE